MVQISSENSKPLWSVRSGRVTKIYHSLPSSLKRRRTKKNIEHGMSIRYLIFGVNSVTASHLICHDSLLQNATDVITKCDSYFIIKRDRSLLQNASGFLLQNATNLLQNATVITKCGSYYKMQRLLQIAIVHKLLDWFQNYYLKSNISKYVT